MCCAYKIFNLGTIFCLKILEEIKNKKIAIYSFVYWK